ncbi:cytochrome-c peroxidase [Hufsiella ginkgonis]|uniref:Cytochrome-c peroxidase n=1 Tax=Hufsiella ginkgonis TaxID=2695274 RepID=A0A7K1XX32_9SPHI|nr:cytochrome c peroxidase [Hufsiella ginkgonis]MXV15076.1 cytochrome-c peroxidase [Hufsiella ginkgonis]
MRDRKKSNVRVVPAILCLAVCAAGFVDGTRPPAPYRLDYPPGFGNRINIPANNPTTQAGVLVGRWLFYEKALSVNNRVSCGSCHVQEKAFSDGLAFSTGVGGTPVARNSMSLANLLWSRRFFWDGRAAGLEQQAVFPLTDPHEMGQSLAISARKISMMPRYALLFKQAYGDVRVTGERIVKAIAQFERTLISANSPYDRYLDGRYRPTAEEQKGLLLFNAAPEPTRAIRGANCARCHGGVKTYMELFHNNGLDSLPGDAGIEKLTGLPGDRGRFKAPTLRNIALTAPYMHDGRFNTLDEVLDHYSEHVKQSPSLSPVFRDASNEPAGRNLALRPEEKKQVIAFLHMLTDSTFTTDPRFSDPRTIPRKPKAAK